MFILQRIGTFAFSVSITAFLLTAFLLAGCNTIEGAGEDIEKGGEEIQEQAD